MHFCKVSLRPQGFSRDFGSAKLRFVPLPCGCLSPRAAIKLALLAVLTRFRGPAPMRLPFAARPPKTCASLRPHAFSMAHRRDPQRFEPIRGGRPKPFETRANPGQPGRRDAMICVCFLCIAMTQVNLFEHVSCGGCFRCIAIRTDSRVHLPCLCSHQYKFPAD